MAALTERHTQVGRVHRVLVRGHRGRTRVPLPPSLHAASLGRALLSRSYASARSNEPLNNCLLMIN